MRAILTTFLTFVAQEAYRPRHQRPDVLDGLTVPATLGEPSWLPTTPTPAQRALAQAEKDEHEAKEAWYRRHLPDDCYRASIRTTHEAKWAVTK